MASADYVITTGKITATASATKSLWLLNPVTNQVSIIGIDISLDGSTAAASVQFDLYTVTTIGSAAGATGVVNKMNPGIPAATTTALTALTTEPTTVVVLASWYVTPFGGLFPYQLPLGREFVMAGAGVRWGLRWTTASGVTPDIISNVYIEE